MKIKAIVFDFDGVFILDSEVIFKQEAWRKVFKSYDDAYLPHLKEGNSLFGSGKKGGRKEIMRHVFEKLGEPTDKLDELVEEGLHVFGKHVHTRCLEAGLVDGVLETLEDLKQRGIPMYISSGTATAPLRAVVKDLGIEDFFAGVLGSTPEPVGGGKVDNLAYAAAKEGVTDFGEILVVGDGSSDEKSAEETAAQFLAFANTHNKWHDRKDVRVVSDLRDVVAYVDEMNG